MPDLNDASLSQHAVRHVHIVELGRRQVPGQRKDGCGAVVQLERWLWVSQAQVGVVESLDGPNVLPVPVKEERLHLAYSTQHAAWKGVGKGKKKLLTG